MSRTAFGRADNFVEVFFFFGEERLFLFLGFLCFGNLHHRVILWIYLNIYN